MSILKRAQPAPAAQPAAQPDPVPTAQAAPALSEMELRLLDMELQIKYPGCTPEARKILSDNEKRDALAEEKEKARYFRIKAVQEKREQLVRDNAGEMLKNENLKIVLDGERVHELKNGVCVCPECGQILPDTGTIITALSERWLNSSGDMNRLMVQDHRAPYGGLPCVSVPSTCKACGSSHSVLLMVCLTV